MKDTTRLLLGITLNLLAEVDHNDLTTCQREAFLAAECLLTTIEADEPDAELIEYAASQGVTIPHEPMN